MKRVSSWCGFVVVVAAMFVLPSSAAATITGIPLRNPNPPVIPVVPQGPAPAAPLSGFAPITGASWAGVSDPSVTPPDPNGAIGPNSYVEIINDQIGIYSRAGVAMSTATLATLTGDTGSLSDPTVLWDPSTNRFYYNVWDFNTNAMHWGFSKTTNPTTIPTSFCNYSTSFGYAVGELPDYPKLGQSKNFLMIGVNHYPNASAQHDNRSDLLWIDKPQATRAITTCPPASRFLHGVFQNLRNADGSESFTPVPAIQTDPSSTGYVLTESDIETPCPGCQGTLITVHTLTPSVANPKIPVFTTTGHSITVPAFANPLPAPQKGTTAKLDTLDGRLEKAVAAIDPQLGQIVLWTGHSVLSSGGRSEFRWYEILPTPVATPTLVSSGVVKSSSLFVFNGSVAPDRTVNTTGAAHGDSIVIGFSTSSSTTFPAAQMVSKVGAGALSPFVMVHQSATADSDFSCTQLPNCRWGDYSSASPDPAQSLTAPHGEVWLSNEAVTAGLNTTWNWEAKP